MGLVFDWFGNFRVTYLSCTVELRITNTIVINFELIYAIYVRYLESSLIFATANMVQCGAHKWIDAHKFQLDVICTEWLPFATAQLFNRNGVNDWIGNCVV